MKNVYFNNYRRRNQSSVSLSDKTQKKNDKRNSNKKIWNNNDKIPIYKE